MDPRRRTEFVRLVKAISHPDYKPVFAAAGLTPLEHAIVKRWGTSPYIGFHAIGKLHGISDAAARRHFDNALDKLKPHWPKENA